MLTRLLTICMPCLLVGTLLPGVVAGELIQDPARVGRFSQPFVEPTIDGRPTRQTCIEGEDPKFPRCKPAAAAIALLSRNRLLYFNAIENTEGLRLSAIAEYGQTAVNDQSRLLDLSGSTPIWSRPRPVRANTSAGPVDAEQLLPPGPLNDAEQPEFSYNDQALFCADVNFLPDGRLLATGGTNYYSEPRIPGTDLGVAELEGLKQSRIFDPATNRWTASGQMRYGRWYPTLVSLPNGDQLVASGVTKLLKPIYPAHPLDSGRNVVQTETYHVKAARWSTNPPSADRSLPLFPRLHLLPNGDVYYNAGGQAFNPLGESYDEALWNIAAVYDPVRKTWTDLGIPGLGTVAPGFRGSTSSVMLPLRPDKDGAYTKAEFLTTGGVLLPTPGSYLPVAFSRIETVDTSGDTPRLFSRATGSLSQPRWYGQGVVLPEGSVLMLSGANRDELVTPNVGMPIMTPELFDPATETWRPVARQRHARTYHNTALLLEDGRVLVGGHAPAPTLYLRNITLPGGFTPASRDPSFEIYSPPYLFRGRRPVITSVATSARYGQELEIKTPDAKEIASVVLVRRASVTHLVDGDQRTVVLPIKAVSDGSLIVKAPPSGAVAPPGDYLLFVNRGTGQGLIPSVSRPVRISA
jgi:Domain of unknown function (DUF1929)